MPSEKDVQRADKTRDISMDMMVVIEPTVRAHKGRKYRRASWQINAFGHRTFRRTKKGTFTGIIQALRKKHEAK